MKFTRNVVQTHTRKSIKRKCFVFLMPIHDSKRHVICFRMHMLSSLMLKLLWCSITPFLFFLSMRFFFLSFSWVESQTENKKLYALPPREYNRCCRWQEWLISLGTHLHVGHTYSNKDNLQSDWSAWISCDGAGLIDLLAFLITLPFRYPTRARSEDKPVRNDQPNVYSSTLMVSPGACI